MKVNVLRQETPLHEPYWESFRYDGPMDNTVAGLLDYINFHDDIINDQGERTTRIGWECSCIQGICGACAMLVNDKPSLACEAFLRDIEEPEITLKPLSRFPTVHDLVVDRSSIHESLMDNNVYIGEYSPAENTDVWQDYAVAKCIKCGLCLEVCPKYTDGRRFYGAPFANDCYLVAARNREKTGEIAEIYEEHFQRECAYDLACDKVCPVGIKITASMKMLNALTRAAGENESSDCPGI